MQSHSHNPANEQNIKLNNKFKAQNVIPNIFEYAEEPKVS
jgi:hypothetical protein